MESKRNELTYFFLIAFAWMWLLNLPRVLASFDVIEIPALLSTILGYTAVFGPGIAGFVLTRIRSGKEGVKALWQNGWRLQFPKKWLVPALVLMPAAGLVTLFLMRIFNQSIPWEYGLSPAMIVPIGLLIWLVGAYPEEYGWRGYALPRMLEKYSPLTASLVLGIIWSIWHLPLHFIPTTTQAAIPIWEYGLQLIVLTVIFTWLHINTKGSVFIASLFHAMGNLTGAVIPYWATSIGRLISFLVLLIPVILIVLHWQKKSKQQSAPEA